MADAKIKTMRAELAAIDASILEIEKDNSESLSYEDWQVNRVRLETLKRERHDLNLRIQNRVARLSGRSYVFGRYLERVRSYDDLDAVRDDGDGGDATPETPVDPGDGDITEPETPLEPSMPGIDPSTLTSYFVAVDAPADTATPEDDVASLFTPAAFQAGVSFTGRDVEPPGNYDVRKVEGLAIHPDLPFTHIIASPNALRQDVTSFYVRKSDVEIGGQTYPRFLAVRPGNWQNSTPDFLPLFNLHFRLEDN